MESCELVTKRCKQWRLQNVYLLKMKCRTKVNKHENDISNIQREIVNEHMNNVQIELLSSFNYLRSIRDSKQN